MNVSKVREKYLAFFEKRGHTIVPSASLVPENDPTTLFTGSGMQPMVPFLLGEPHPLGTRIADSQKCFRAEDIDEVGDNRHTTFFEMLGNWSLGDYFKREQLRWSFEFMTDKEEGLGLDPERLYVTVFAGDAENDLLADDTSIEIWKGLFGEKDIDAKFVELGTEERGGEKGMQGGRIFSYGAKENWWSRAGTPTTMPAGEPGGPDSEVFYEFEDVEHDTRFGEHCHPNCDCGRFLEIGNSVFMQYRKREDGTFEHLPKENVDFGGGLERLTAATLGTSDVFAIDTLRGVIRAIEERAVGSYEEVEYMESYRVVADHIRGVVFMIADGVEPSNTERGYVARRLIRRAVRHMRHVSERMTLADLVSVVVGLYGDTYPDVERAQEEVERIVRGEEEKFGATLERGLREFEKRIEGVETLSGKDAFELFSTYGFPVDMTEELAAERGKAIDREAFEKEFALHREVSRAGAEKKFQGGLADHSEMSVKYHTATHLLHAALRHVLGEHIEQKGSNITPDRLRFDFTHDEKLSDEEKQQVEDFVNMSIDDALPVMCEEKPLEEARTEGALGVFGEKYADTVKVYRVGEREKPVSLEICGGPHVENTSELGHFRIKKEEASSAGVRRIKAVLE